MQSHKSLLRAICLTAVFAGAALGGAQASTVFRVPIVGLHGTVTQVSASVSPTSLAFGSIPVNTSTSAQSVVLTNTGNQPLTISSVQASGMYAQTNNCPSSLATGATCTANVTFSATAMGSQPGTLTFSTSAGNEVVSLSGSGQQTSDASSTATLSFGNQQVGTNSSAQTVQLTNTGNTTVSISSVAATGPYGVSTSCGSSLAVGGSCIANVTFSPTAAGSQPGTLTFATNAGNQAVSLSGTGIQAFLSASPASLAFGNVTSGQSSTQTFTLQNSGAAPATALAIGVSGGFSDTSNCGSTLAAGNSCTVTVTFAPTSVTSYSTTLQVTTTTGSTLSVPLTGTGLSACTAGSVAFAYTGSAQSFSIPSGCSTFTVKAWGGGGGSDDGNGGAGAFVTATFPAAASPVTVLVAAGGSPSVLTGDATGMTGFAGGGGASSIKNGSGMLLVAGGGGDAPFFTTGGVGGAPTGQNGGLFQTGCSNATGATSSAVGTDSSPASGFTVPSGNTLYAPSGMTGGGMISGGVGFSGGGSGYFGGGGGIDAQSSSSVCFAAGAGGSSWVNTGIGTNSSMTAGSGSTAPNTADADYASGVAAGSVTTSNVNGNGGAGRVVIHYQ